MGIAVWDQPVHSWFVARRSHGATILWEIVTAVVLAYLLLSRHSTTVLRAVAVIAAVVLIPAVAISRLYLGFHWFSVVMASVALAVVMLGRVLAVDTWQPLQKYSIAARRPKAVPEPARQLPQPSP